MALSVPQISVFEGYVSPNVASVLAAAESLSILERRHLLELLIAGLDGTPVTEQAACVLRETWRREVAHSSAEYDAGRVDTVSWQEVLARWKSRTKASAANKPPQ